MLEDILRAGFRELELPLDETALRRYRIYYENLEQTNRVMNLTAITGEEDAARLHFLDCAALLKLADLRGKTLVDVGTGAGFPGLALKIACPEIGLTLLDSLDKRIGFLRDTCEKLELTDVTCLHARAEEIPDGLRESFDFASARAVARLNVLCELCLPYVRPGGAFLAMKGPEPQEEIDEAARAVSILGGQLGKTFFYDVPGTDVRHSVVVVRKIAPTPEKYPRRFAKMQKQPL